MGLPSPETLKRKASQGSTDRLVLSGVLGEDYWLNGKRFEERHGVSRSRLEQTKRKLIDRGKREYRDYIRDQERRAASSSGSISNPNTSKFVTSQNIKEKQLQDRKNQTKKVTVSASIQDKQFSRQPILKEKEFKRVAKQFDPRDMALMSKVNSRQPLSKADENRINKIVQEQNLNKSQSNFLQKALALPVNTNKQVVTGTAEVATELKDLAVNSIVGAFNYGKQLRKRYEKG